MMSFAFMTPRHILTSGLCLGILTTLGLTISSPVVITPAAAESAIATPKNVTTNQLVGTWQGELAPGQMITWIFTEDGQFFMTVSPMADEPQRALKMLYEIEYTTKPMGLNIELSEGNTVFTIFEMTPEGQMRVQIAGTNPGEPRPTEFNNPAVFEKVSEGTTLPENTEILE